MICAGGVFIFQKFTYTLSPIRTRTADNSNIQIESMTWALQTILPVRLTDPGQSGTRTNLGYHQSVLREVYVYVLPKLLTHTGCDTSQTPLPFLPNETAPTIPPPGYSTHKCRHHHPGMPNYTPTTLQLPSTYPRVVCMGIHVQRQEVDCLTVDRQTDVTIRTPVNL